MNPTNPEHWYAVYTKHQHEKLAVAGRIHQIDIPIAFAYMHTGEGEALLATRCTTCRKCDEIRRGTRLTASQ